MDIVENCTEKYIYENFLGIETRNIKLFQNYGVIFNIDSIKDFELIAKRDRQSKYSEWKLIKRN